MAAVLVFAIGLLAGSTSVSGARVNVHEHEAASALVETTEGCSLSTLAAAQEALNGAILHSLNKVPGMQKVAATWKVAWLEFQARHAFDNACTPAKEEECNAKGVGLNKEHCVNFDSLGGYQTTGECVKCGDHPNGAPDCESADGPNAGEPNIGVSLLETEAGEAEVATKKSSSSGFGASPTYSAVGCPTDLSTAAVYLAELIPNLKKLSGFEEVGNGWSIQELLAKANSLADDTCNNAANEQKCDVQGLHCVNVDGPGGALTSHTCMECGEWGNPYC